jgi:transposase
MAKTNEKKIARILYVQQGKSAKEVSELVGVREQTVGQWVELENWKTLRASHSSSPEERLKNLRTVVDKLAERQLEIMDKPEYDNKETDLAKNADQISKWSKAIEAVKRENEIPLSLYVRVMDRVFTALHMHDQNLFIKSLDFQEKHLAEISSKLN